MTTGPSSTTRRKLAPLARAALVALVVVLAAAACGKRGAPELPEGEKDALGRTYPAPSTYPAQ